MFCIYTISIGGSFVWIGILGVVFSHAHRLASLKKEKEEAAKLANKGK